MNPRQVFQDVQPSTAQPPAAPNPAAPSVTPTPRSMSSPMTSSAGATFPPSAASTSPQPTSSAPPVNPNGLPLPPANGFSTPQPNPIQPAAPTPQSAAASQPLTASSPQHPNAAATSIPNTPLATTPIEKPRPAPKIAWLQDLIGLAVFIIVVIVGAWLINMFVFRSFSVVGPSMQPTLEGENGQHDRLIVNIVPVTGSHITGKEYLPPRGQIIVFKNPLFTPGNPDEYIVKRVIGLPGERVTVNSCTLKVYNDEHPDGFDPYPSFTNLAANDAQVNPCVAGSGTDVTVPEGEIFVVGDHRADTYSMDSRNGDGRISLGTIPLDDVIGPVALRIMPISDFTVF